MTKWIPFILWLTIAVSSSGCSSMANVDVTRVLTSGRDGWQHPERVIEALSIEPGDTVAEIGAGSGYWLPWLSEAVGPKGRVIAIDVEPKIVAKLESRVAREGYANVDVQLAAYDDPGLPGGSIDLALTCLTYHHLENRVAYFERVKGALRSEGRVAHLDDRHDSGAPVSWFQSNGHTIDPALVTSEMRDANYVRTENLEFLPAQSFQIFRPQTETSDAESAEDAAHQVGHVEHGPSIGAR